MGIAAVASNVLEACGVRPDVYRSLANGEAMRLVTPGSTGPQPVVMRFAKDVSPLMLRTQNIQTGASGITYQAAPFVPDARTERLVGEPVLSKIFAVAPNAALPQTTTVGLYRSPGVVRDLSTDRLGDVDPKAELFGILVITAPNESVALGPQQQERNANYHSGDTATLNGFAQGWLVGTLAKNTQTNRPEFTARGYVLDRTALVPKP